MKILYPSSRDLLIVNNCDDYIGVSYLKFSIFAPMICSPPGRRCKLK